MSAYFTYSARWDISQRLRACRSGKCGDHRECGETHVYGWSRSAIDEVGLVWMRNATLMDAIDQREKIRPRRAAGRTRETRYIL